MKLFKLSLSIVLGLALFTALGATAFVYLGLFPPGADEPHSDLVYTLLQTTRERGIASRMQGITVPPLNDPPLIRKGAGNYNAMCSGCHLMPGAKDSELSRGLYPAPPALAKIDNLDPAKAFWVIKHGIKASGMPAWGKSMDDDTIWGMVAFLKKLPALSAEQYKTEVACSGGHSHGGSTTVEHHHDEAESAAHEHGAEHHHDEGADHSHDGNAGPDCGSGAMVKPNEHDHAAESTSGHDEHEASGMTMPTDAVVTDSHKHKAEEAEHAHSNEMGNPANSMNMPMDNPHPQPQQPEGNAEPSHANSTIPTKDHSQMQGMDHSKMTAMNSGATAAPKSLPIKNAAEAAVQAFQDALQVGNRSLALQWLAADVHIQEGGHTETSREAYAGEHLQNDIDFLKASRVYPQIRTSNVHGDTATVRSQTRIVGKSGGKPIDILSNEIATVRKTAEGWRIVRIEWSSVDAEDKPARHQH